MDILGFVLVLLCTVFFHELGHFWVARIFKMKVLEFSVGMGMPLISKTDKQGTLWKLALIPIGGYVRISESKKDGYDTHPVYQRFLMTFAGPAFSILFGWIMFFGLFSIWGQPTLADYQTTGIYQVVPDSPAGTIDLQTGDIITHMQSGGDVKQIASFYDLYMAVQFFKARDITLTVKRGDTTYQNTIKAKAYKTESGDIIYRIGVRGFPITYTSMRIQDIFTRTTEVTWHTMTIIYDAILRMFKGEIKREELGGPIKIANMAGDSLGLGIRQFIVFLGAFSINLGLFNLIPLPVLDGGRMVLLCAEGIMRRPLSVSVSRFLIAWSMSVVLCFMVFVTLIDLGIL